MTSQRATSRPCLRRWCRCSTARATVVVEMSSRRGTPEWPHGLQVVQSKAYGETTVYYAEPVR